MSFSCYYSSKSVFKHICGIKTGRGGGGQRLACLLSLNDGRSQRGALWVSAVLMSALGVAAGLWYGQTYVTNTKQGQQVLRASRAGVSYGIGNDCNNSMYN